MKPLMAALAALVLSASCASLLMAPRGGILIGTREVGREKTHEVVQVTSYEGTFRSLQFASKYNSIHLSNVVIHFGNGETEKLKADEVIPNGGHSGFFQLAGGRRHIESVDFDYQAEGGWIGGKAEVFVYGVR